jgi:hypothetical protein
MPEAVAEICVDAHVRDSLIEDARLDAQLEEFYEEDAADRYAARNRLRRRELLRTVHECRVRMNYRERQRRQAPCKVRW